MHIREATPEDALAIADVHVRSWKSAYPGLLPQDYLDQLRPEHRVAQWETTLASTHWPGSGMFVLVDGADGIRADGIRADGIRADGMHGIAADEKQDVKGFSHLCPTRDDDLDPATTGEITSIYLAPEAWGGGNGVALIKRSLDQLATAGYETATLWALDTNTKARRFYEIGGWRHDGTTKIHDWGQFVCTDVRYVLDLTDWPTRI
ncbi:MAG: GNAT family N-acetyltransferase [Acidimicrobiales bacterium]